MITWLIFFSAQLGICVETGMNNGRKRPIRLIMHEKRDNGSFEDPCQLGCPIRDAGRFPKQFKVLPRMGRILIVENSYKMFILLDNVRWKACCSFHGCR